MKEAEITKFLVSFTGQIEYVTFPCGVFDAFVYVNYEVVWGPDWEPVSGLSSGTSQLSRSGDNPERVVINMPIEMVLSSTNISGWPQLVITVRAQNPLMGDTLHGYAVTLFPPTVDARNINAPLVRPRPSTMLGEWLAWATGKWPELADPKMLAHGKDNYCSHRLTTACLMVSNSVVYDEARLARRNRFTLDLKTAGLNFTGNRDSVLRTESYGSVSIRLAMVSKDLRRLGYDNQPPHHIK